MPTDKVQIQATVRHHLDGQAALDLPVDALGSDSIRDLFSEYLSAESLLVNHCVVTDLDDGVQITGLSTQAPFVGLAVQATIVVVDGEAAFRMQATTVPHWSLVDAFPVLRPTIFFDLRFAGQSTLMLASYDDSDAQPRGLSLSGDLALDAYMGVLAALFGDPEHLTVSGPITLTDGIPVVELRAPKGTSVAFGFFNDVTFDFALRSHVVYPAKPGTTLPPRPDGTMAISAQIPFSAQGQDHSLTIRTVFQSPLSLLVFQVDLNGVVSAAFDELKYLLHDTPFPIPDGFNVENVVTLTDLVFHVDPIEKQLLSVGTGIASATSWPIVPGKVEIEQVALYAILADPLADDRELQLIVTGRIKLADDVHLELSASMPDYVFGGDLEEGSQIDIVAVGEYFLGSLPEVPRIVVTKLGFKAQPSQSRYSGTVEVGFGGSGWTIDLGPNESLELEDVYLDVAYTPADGATGQLGVTIGVGTARLFLLADHASSDSGWSFSGSTEEGDEIDAGALFTDIGRKFGVDLPDFSDDLLLENVKVTFNTKSRDFTFACEGKLHVEGNPLDVNLYIEITHPSGTYQAKVTGDLTVDVTSETGTDQITFDLKLVKGQAASAIVASFTQTDTGPTPTLRSLVGSLSQDAATYIPSDLVLDIKTIVFAMYKDTAGTGVLFGLDVAAQFSLTDLPVLGKEFPADLSVNVDDLQVMLTSRSFDGTAVTTMNPLLPQGKAQLPAQGVDKGGFLSATMGFGSQSMPLDLPVNSGQSPAQPAQSPSGGTTPTAPAIPVTASDTAKWFTLQKAFGPLHLNRVGVRYQDGAAWFLLDAALTAAGLTISLDGLGVGSPLRKFEPKVDLRGLGIDFRKDPIEIAAAFLLTHRTDRQGNSYDEYDGLAVLKAKALTLSALGSYALVEDHPSLFLYAVLDYPLGGPAFFYVTGLAVGFGYNRSLTVPPIDQVAQFPLVSAAVNGDSPPSDVNGLADELNKLATYIAPELGQYFVAIGIKFTSFKLIDSFVLLTIAFGDEFELDVLGLSTVILPTPVPGEPAALTPLAEVQMALEINFVPARGFLGISAQLTSASYIVSRACHLTGGFAFWSWFSGPHEGDFVVTIGGYHPSFSVPDHYPRVPRVGLNWQVDSNLSLKAGAYCALTGSALMAGLALQATWSSGSIKAWFDASADFLIYWKPLHYDVTVHVEVGGSYTFHFLGTHHISIDASADLHLWGPELSGNARIHVSVVSFEVSFSTGPAPAPQPLSWPIFKQSFLPADDAICSIAVTDGLVTGGQTADDFGVVNPLQFVMVTGAAIPSSVLHLRDDLALGTVYSTDDSGQAVVLPFRADSETAPFAQVPPTGAQTIVAGTCGIAPMAKGPGEVVSTHTITITRDGEGAEHHFAYTPILKSMPTGLWGSSPGGDVNRDRFIANAVSGFELRPANPPTGGITAPIKRDILLFDPQPVPSAFDWAGDVPPFDPPPLDEAARRQRIADTLVASAGARATLLAALGIDAGAVDLNAASASAAADGFIVAPQVGAA